MSYILKYKEYQRELEGEFNDFEDELSDYKTEDATANRKYTALKSTTDEFVTAAKDTANSAKGMASAAKEMLKDVANIITDNVSAAGDVAKDNAKPLFEKAKSILLIIMITAAIAFYAGIQYQINKTEEVDNKVRQATLQLKK